MTILADEYFQDSISNYGYTPSQEDYLRAADLLAKVNALFPDCQLRSGHRTREKTEALIAAGYRATVGGQHEQSNAVDIADPHNTLDDGLDDDQLAAAGLYREDPRYTAGPSGWVHLQRVAPPSGHHTFIP